MKRVIFLIDGFNLYHSIADLRKKEYKWLDFSKLVQNYLNDDEIVHGIYYFTSICPWDEKKEKRHKILIKALMSKEVKIVYGNFKERHKFYSNIRIRVTFNYHEEKQTDVNIAVYLMRLAIENKYDTAILISGDNDLSPAVIAVKELFSEKRVGIVSPLNRRSNELEKLADFHKLMEEEHIKNSLFPEVVDIGEGRNIYCPHEWR